MKIKKHILIFVILCSIIPQSACNFVELAVLSVDIFSVDTSPSSFDINSDQEYDFTVSISYENPTSHRTELRLWLEKCRDVDPYLTAKVVIIEPFDSGTKEITFTDNPNRWNGFSAVEFKAELTAYQQPYLNTLLDMAEMDTLVYAEDIFTFF